MNNYCNQCARKCNVDRDTQVGFCKSTNTILISKVMIHHWEEPIISGTRGSGAIFFTNCNLNCVYCQNYQISSLGKGTQINTTQLAQIFRKLENLGVHNINLVTPTHYTEQIIDALSIYKPNIPIIWNTNSYESINTINKLKDYVDVFLFDLKYHDQQLSTKYSNTPDYFNIASQNILTAKKYLPNNIIENNLIQKGIIIRHLILPNCTNDSISILNWIHKHIPNTIISLMGQYTPYYKAKDFPEINRKISKLEYKRVLTHCKNLNLKGFMQDLSSASEDYIPDFSQQLDLDNLF